MRHEWLLEHRKTEADYWWFVNKRRLVLQLLDAYAPDRGVLLEAGSGGGLFASILQEHGWRVVATDLAPDAARFARAHGVRHAIAMDAATGWPFADDSAEALVMLDVLEHIEDDTAALAEVRRVLRPGGIAVVSVPAYQWLFSSWDAYNEHYRRYTGTRLRKCAQAAGLEVLRLSYWNAVSLPPAICLRLKDRLAGVEYERLEYPPVPRVVNAALIAYGRIESTWLQWGSMPAGLSVAVVLRNVDAASCRIEDREQRPT